MQAIENLMKKRGKFDYVLLETSGLANPGMHALTHRMSQMFSKHIYTLIQSISIPVMTAHRSDCRHVLDRRGAAV